MHYITKVGKITYFSTLTNSGYLEVESKRYDFSLMKFISFREYKFPRSGESVEVIFRITKAGYVVLVVISCS
jgi:hypothetical protein